MYKGGQWRPLVLEAIFVESEGWRYTKLPTSGPWGYQPVVSMRGPLGNRMKYVFLHECSVYQSSDPAGKLQAATGHRHRCQAATFLAFVPYLFGNPRAVRDQPNKP